MRVSGERIPVAIERLTLEMMNWIEGRKSWTNSIPDPAQCAIVDAMEVVKLSAAIQALAALKS